MPDASKLEIVQPPVSSKPRERLPRNACDTHTHVFGPFDSFPFVTPPSYPPPLAPFEVHSAMLSCVGVERGILVQPAPYGTDNTALLDALRRGNGKLRGVAVATASITDSELSVLSNAGVRGLRFNEMIDSQTGGRFRGSVGVEQLKCLAPRMKELGWHAQVWARFEDVPSLAKEITQLGIQVVFEHMAGLRTEPGIANGAFEEILGLLTEGVIWVKLSVCRSSSAYPNYSDLRPFHDALINANPSRLLWASDWPFVRLSNVSPDAGRLVDLFCDWVVDTELRRKILVDNATALYGGQQCNDQ